MRNWNTEKNQGMSLVELLVAVAVLGISMIGIVALMNLATRYYSNSNKEVEVQQELQTTFAMVSNMIVDANGSVTFDTSTKTATIVNKQKKYVVTLSGTNLYAKEFLATATITDIKAPENLLADKVESFSLNTSHYDDGYVTLAMKVKYGSREAAMTKNVFMRNAGKERTDFLGYCDVEVTEVTGGIQFKITQNTGATINNGTPLDIKIKMGAAGAFSSVTGVGISSISTANRYYNQVTGVLTVHTKLSAGWVDGASITVTVKVSGTIDKNDSRVLTISK